MTLQNLLAIQRLLAFEASRDDVQRLLGSEAHEVNGYG